MSGWPYRVKKKKKRGLIPINMKKKKPTKNRNTQRQSVWSISPCSLVEVPLSGQFANTNSATHVRLFLPCNRKVQSRRERSRAFWVSSFTPLQGGILATKDSTWSVLGITERQKHNLYNRQFKLYYCSSNSTTRHLLQKKEAIHSNSRQWIALNPFPFTST